MESLCIFAGEVCPHALRAAFDLLTLSNARNCFYLGQTEFKTLPATLTESWKKLRELGEHSITIKHWKQI